MLDWFYDTPIVRAILEIDKKDIIIKSNISNFRKKIEAKRLRSRKNRKKRLKSKK